MSEVIDNFAVDVRKSFAEMATSFDEMATSFANVAADEERYAKQVAALFKQLEDQAAAGGTISAADLETIAQVRNEGVAMSLRTRAAADQAKAIADAVPDPPAAPAA